MLEQILVLFSLLTIQSGRFQKDPRVPVTIEVLRDVILERPDPSVRNTPRRRGVLETWSTMEEPTTIKKGARFQTVEILGEGGCVIELQRERYSLSSCWWMSGFTDRQEDFFRVLPRR